MSEPAIGFILQPSYRIEAGRAVVCLYGKLASGEPFLVRDDRQRPHFFVRAADRELAARLGARPLAPTDQHTFAGEPVLRVEVATPPDVPALRERLEAQGIPCFEADIRFALRLPIDRGIRSAVAIDGPSRVEPGVGRIFDNPALSPASFRPSLSVLSFDIETDPKAKRLLSIALAGCGVEEVLLLTPPGWSCPEGAIPCASERELLAAFARRVRELDPDILTGWNVVDFDCTTLAAMAAAWGLPLELGRGAGGLRIRREKSGWAASQAQVPGRLVLDGINLLRGAFIRLEEYSLDAVAQHVLGRGKLVTGHDRGEEILRLFRHDRARLVEYNLTDARLVLEILGKLELFELAIERSLLTGMPLDRVSASIASFDFLVLSELRHQRAVAPSVAGEAEIEIPTGGGHVLEPLPGLFEQVLVFDFKSLYPSLIRTFEIDPLGFVPHPEPGADLIQAPNGAHFRRARGILTGLLDELFPRREAAKKAGNAVASHAIKILMNSFYGVLGTPACRFYNPHVANAITSFGREVLLWSKARFEELGHRVLYGDTDSLFVASGETDGGAARLVGEALKERLNRDLAAHLSARYRVVSKLELVFERLYAKLHLTAVRHGTAGARKRYAGWIETPAGHEVVFTGLESVRRDATALAKRVQRGLYERLFAGEPVAHYLRETVAKLRAGELDAELVYKKALRKAPAEYTATTPPHVAAARKLTHVPRRGLVSYLLTTAGPEPASEAKHPPDYQHYIDKQIRPVAEPVLELLGLRFEAVIGEERQLVLF